MSTNVNIVAANTSPLSEVNKASVSPRDEKGRFKKGFSGNPHAWATRKLNSPLALLCREKVEDWADVLDSIIRNEQVDPAVRIVALKIGFEYGYGKPLQGSDVRIREDSDYDRHIEFLTREIHQEFDFLKNDIVGLEQEIKQFIVQKTGNSDFVDTIFDDILKHVGSAAFRCYIGKLNKEGCYYKYIS